MPPPEDELSLHERIRNRRHSMGLAGYELARLAGISPSYLSLIESGAKVPSEEIALALAKALGDNPDLYLAWVHAGRLQDVPTHMARLGLLQRLIGRPDSRRRVQSGQDLRAEDEIVPHAALARASERSQRLRARIESAAEDTLLGMAERSDALEVPLLAEGSDPGTDPAASTGVVETLRIDPRLLPPDVERPFAYRPGPAAIAGLEDALAPGDLVLLTSRVDLPPVPSAIYAVRSKAGVVLTRVIQHEDVLLEISTDPRQQPTAHDVAVQGALERRLAGRVVATLRTWPATAAPRSSAQRQQWRSRPRGRSVQVEGDFLVRDCEWREDYGWRPIQRPEDLDWLEAHPGTKIRFRLIRDGRVRYLLEMTPAEWREALGDYVEGTTWRSNGYIVAVTKRSSGEYGEEFQERWARFVRAVHP